MRFQNLNLRTLESNLSDFYISENLVEQLKRFNILTLIDLANYTKSFLKNRLSNAHYTESVTLLLKYRIFKNFDLKKVIRSYNKIEDEDFNIEKIKIFLKSSKSRSVINFCEEIEINKDLLFYHFADLLLNENFPEIKISPYQLDIVNKEIRLAYKTTVAALDVKDYNLEIIGSFLENYKNPIIQLFFKKSKISQSILMLHLSDKLTKHNLSNIRGWGPKKFTLLNDAISEGILFHDFIIKLFPDVEILNKAIKYKYLHFNNINTLNKKLSALELTLLSLPKHANIITDYIVNGKSKDELVTKYNLTRERIRQIINSALKFKLIPDAYNFYIENGFQQKENEFISKKEIILLNYNLKAKYKQGPNIQNQLQLFYYEIFGYKYYKLYNFDLGEKFYLNKDFYSSHRETFKFFNNKLSNNGFVRTDELDNEFYQFFVSNYKFILPDIILGLNFLYIPQKINIKNIGEIAVDNNIDDNGLVDTKGVFRWIHENFPEKGPKTIESMRALLMRNNLIFAYGKTGNYQKVSVKGEKTFHTVEVIIDILNKSKHPLHVMEIEDLVQERNPYLKDRGVAMIIDINPDKFIKFTHTGFVGLKNKKYTRIPTKLPKKQINKYLKSKSLSIEWLSFDYLINEYGVNDYQLIDFIENSNEYIYLDNLITLSTKNKNKDKLIKKLCKEEKLIPHIKGTYLNKSITEKINFRDKLIDIINTNYGIILSSDEISKIINFII